MKLFDQLLIDEAEGDKVESEGGGDDSSGWVAEPVRILRERERD